MRIPFMMNDEITPNIVIVDNPGFGQPNYRVVTSLLYMVDISMMSALDRQPFSSGKCYVVHWENAPMCSRCSAADIIYLSANDDYWCQWVYQFAHEYCHHLINGSLTGEWSSLLWFEETVCELSSLYNLCEMETFCERNGLVYYAPSVRKYREDLMVRGSQTYDLDVAGGWRKEYEDLLSTGGYQRDLYNAIAVRMYPLFVENPKLWKLILHIGNIREWDSLDELFDHLISTADASYEESLNRLRAVFI